MPPVCGLKSQIPPHTHTHTQALVALTGGKVPTPEARTALYRSLNGPKAKCSLQEDRSILVHSIEAHTRQGGEVEGKSLRPLRFLVTLPLHSDACAEWTHMREAVMCFASGAIRPSA